MDEKTLTALKESIVKWRRNSRVRNHENYLTDVDDCPLCGLFYRDNCKGCPVAKAASAFCERTPYYKAENARADWERDWPNGGGIARAAAKEEVAFLESLLPEGETA